ncbi:energy transducer TonB [Gilvimarinus sp. SDUM040013]|uniref:Energy transducer TonB n=1 Tax=Gilvimarinus gilvus TaxID=3058038 RepID=A0ABU4RYF0_9GAMM|nr:energy transducer TonB [Gilvimarinus sp. SDUM040013]MDO3387415.1 energy transducer TonB [Gilvimarinus sp. SDUM040013]MDX6849892.1 energy transducer TonB [Gilvimarinus sp. SDUM040013]
MNFGRVIISIALAVGTTFGLLFLMQALINTDLKADDQEETVRIEDIHMPDTTIETRYEAAKPDKPETPDTPPPDIPEPDFDTPEINPQALNMDAPNLGSDINISTSGLGGDGEYLPIVKVAPQYPRRAAQRGIEGFVTVEYTVTTTGATRDVEVIEAITKDGDETSIFNRAAIRAAEKFKYKPRVIDGTAIEVPGVRNRFTFELQQ